MEFNLVDIRIHLSSNNPHQLQTGIMLRAPSRYPQICREAVCHYPDKDCFTCKCRTECQYHLVFRQELTTDPEALKKHQKPPLPFAFSFPEIIAEKLVCRLVLVGTAISSLEMLLEGFVLFIKSLDSDDECAIEKITSLDYQGSESTIGTENTPLKHKGDIILLSNDGILNNYQKSGELLSIRIMTPLKVLAHGKTQHCFSFKQFMSSVMRRVSSIGYYYADYEFDLDYRELSQQAEKVIELSTKFTFNTHDGVQLSGIIGEGTFIGLSEDLFKFLLPGSFLNVGKGATFGFGGYNINHS